jgi:hypothetical protein
MVFMKIKPSYLVFSEGSKVKKNDKKANGIQYLEWFFLKK